MPKLPIVSRYPGRSYICPFRGTDGRFHCDLCSYVTTYRRNLTMHRRTHTGERLYVCRCCERRFTHKSGLNRHMRTHDTEEQRYSCPECGRIFASSAALAPHLQTHSGEPPFECHYCSAPFDRKGTLALHVAMHVRGAPPFRCHTCDDVFLEEETLDSHMLEAHPGQE